MRVCSFNIFACIYNNFVVYVVIKVNVQMCLCEAGIYLFDLALMKLLISVIIHENG